MMMMMMMMMMSDKQTGNLCSLIMH